MKKQVLFLIVLIVLSCTSTKKTPKKEPAGEPKKELAKEDDFKPKFFAGPSTLVYRTKKDYNNLVPVNLNNEKTEIYSYPHPKDVKTEKGYQTPTVLNGGYLLDNRGINENVAFLKYTYEEYAQLKTLPSKKELFASIVDKEPLIVLCDCGNRKVYKDVVGQLNNMIDKKRLETLCKTLK